MHGVDAVGMNANVKTLLDLKMNKLTFPKCRSETSTITEDMIAALCDSSYAAGMLVGWNLCVAGNSDEFTRIRTSRLLAAAFALKSRRHDCQRKDLAKFEKEE